MPQSLFRLYQFGEFNNYLRQTSFQRKISFIQNHHTWKPNYTHFNAHPNHRVLLENMRHDHIKNRGWSDIGQHLTIFPDGVIALCRPLDVTPAGIKGANTGGICIESLGNFDEGGDEMTAQQRDAILKTNAALCIKFGLQPLPLQVVYHHWYNTSGRRFASTDINSGHVLQKQLQKTCPGTNFFCPPGFAQKGNTIACAVANFYPLVAAEMARLQTAPAPVLQPQLKTVTATLLNVRAGRSVAFRVVRRLNKGIQVPVFQTEGGWAKLSANAEEWAAAQFLSDSM